jgi:acetyltransferase-like isoleucine patch superfamily enzyme
MYNKLLYIMHKALKKIRLSAIKNSEVHWTSKVESGTSFINSVMGKHSFCGYNCEITNTDIGSFCSIANGVVIGGGMHPTDWLSTSPVFYSGRDSVKAKFSSHERVPPKKVSIGHDVWIGQNALIKQGVNIGTGAVVGMGSVVTKDVPAYSIVAGCPAKIIKSRFDAELKTRLLKSEWWDIDESELQNSSYLVKKPILFLESLNK